MKIEMDFIETIAKFQSMEAPETTRSLSEILKNDKLLDKWDVKTVYRSLSDVQKYNAVLHLFRAFTSNKKTLKETLDFLSKEQT